MIDTIYVTDAKIKLIHGVEDKPGRKEVIETDKFCLIIFNREEELCSNYTNNMTEKELIIAIGAMLEVAQGSVCNNCKDVLGSILARHLEAIKEEREYGENTGIN